MSPARTFDSNDPAGQIRTALLALFVSVFLIAGTVGPAAAVVGSPPASSSSAPGDGTQASLASGGNAVDNDSVVVNSNGFVVSGEQVGYGDPEGKAVRNYSTNGVEKTSPIVIRDGDVVSEGGENVTVADGTVEVFDESPDVRARFDNGTVETLVVNDSNIQTESGVNVKTEDGGNVEIDRSSFSNAQFSVDITNTTTVGEGEVMEIEVTVENSGHASGRKEFEVEADGQAIERELIELSPGETKTVTATYQTTSGDAPSVEVTATTPSDSDTVTAPVDEVGFRMYIDDVNSGVSKGEQINVSAVLNRIGGSSERTYAVDLLIDGSVEETELVSLGTGGEATVEFSYLTRLTDAPEVRATVSGPKNATDSRTVAVRNPILSVNEIQPPTNVTEHEQATVTTTVENFGTDTKTQTVQLAVAGQGTDEATVVAEKQVELGGRSTKEVSFTYQTTPELYPKHNLTVSTADHSRTTTVELNATAVHQIKTAPNGNVTAPAGETQSFSPVIRNTGHANGTASVTIKLNGSIAKETDLSLSTGQTESVAFDVTVPENASVTYEIATQDSSTSGKVVPGESNAGTGTESGPTTAANATAAPTTSAEEGGGGDGGGLLGFLPSLTVIITTLVSVLVLGVVVQVVS